MNLFIDSPANSRIKELVKLRESPRRRKERGMFFVEGKNELQCLLTAGRKINEIYYSLREVDETEKKNEILEFKSITKFGSPNAVDGDGDEEPLSFI